MEKREPLKQRLGRFFALVGIVFALTSGVVVTQRLSADALALLIGLGAGVLLMTPLVGLLLLLWRREDARRNAPTASPAPSSLPQVIVVAPPGLYGPPRPALEAEPAAGWAPSTSERKFVVVGSEE